MEHEVARLLPNILIGTFVVGVLLFLLAMQQLRRRRTGSYWRMRRRAGDRGGKLFLISVGLIAASIVLGVITVVGTLIYRNNNRSLNRGPDDLYGIILSPEALLTATYETVAELVTPTLIPITIVPATPLPSTIAIPTASPTPLPPSPIPSPTLTATATATATATLTVAPTEDFAAVLKLTPIFNTTPRPPTPGFRLSLDSASDGVDSESQSSTHQFNTGIKRIYLFISFGGMENGVAWSRVLYRDGVPIQGNTLLWSLGTSGNSYFFFGDEMGYSAGSYEVRLYVGAQQASRYSFEVKP